ncbi:hypothetical protein KIN20_004693 [Parelaphostrongylus tenuis]|uniref:Uncharacterized protein n=1 Tax=Parelaphostrongylus tenuis TaxID=148309 RepID=A0AAD5M123_PARTN|nr:hypothetical protein KIN20_004693 [Parelaphostrongylus tenuis]
MTSHLQYKKTLVVHRKSHKNVVYTVFPQGSGRDNLINTVYKLLRTRQRILEPYRTLKNALKQLQEDYLKSKDANPITRYMKLQQSVRDVIIIEKQYWKLLDIPKQDGNEEPNDYVVSRSLEAILLSKGIDDMMSSIITPTTMGHQRMTMWNKVISSELTLGSLNCSKKTIPPPSTAGIGALLSATIGRNVDTRLDQSLYDSIKGRKTEELQKDCENSYAQLYKLIKKYQGLRKIVKDLSDKYDASRFYPIIPRYPILKKMIKSVLRAPEFADICHEQFE